MYPDLVFRFSFQGLKGLPNRNGCCKAKILDATSCVASSACAFVSSSLRALACPDFYLEGCVTKGQDRPNVFL